MALRVGDRIRIIRLPDYGPRGIFPRDTRALFRKLIERNRPLMVREIDERGQPWVQYRWRRRGRLEYHSLAVDPGCWIRVQPNR